jgi:hypothetical protein
MHPKRNPSHRRVGYWIGLGLQVAHGGGEMPTHPLIFLEGLRP